MPTLFYTIVVAYCHRDGIRSRPMDRCYPDCPSPSWYVFAVVRRWTVAGRVLEATVYEHCACRACSALSARAYVVDGAYVPDRVELLS